MIEAENPVLASERRIIKRYSNRKLYDTKGSSYVTLLQIAEMIRAGEDVQIIDNATKEDKTDITLALIISEELRARPRGIPLTTLKALIRHRGERILTQLREGPMGKLMPNKDNPEEIPQVPVGIGAEEDTAAQREARGGFRATLEHWQAVVDERIRAALPNFSTFRELEAQVRRLSERVEVLERKVEEISPPPRE